MANNRGSHQLMLRAELVRALPRLLPPLTISSTRLQPPPAPASLVVEARTPTSRKLRLFLEVRASPAPAHAREHARHLKASLAGRAGSYAMLASRFLSPRVREICREEQVGYVDLAGNCYLRLDDLYVEKVVDKNPFPARGRPASLFSPVSSRIMRALLESRGRAWQVQELAREAGVSLGHTSNVCRRLLDDAHLAKEQGKLKLVEPARLLDAWREAYAPRHRRLPYYSFESALESRMGALARAATAGSLRYAVTSLAAAQLVAPFVRGVTTLEAYISDELEREAWVKALDLRPVEAGANLILLVPDDLGVLDASRVVNGIRVVGDVQLYLDLWTDPGRGREQAEFLRKERLGY